MKAIIMAGGEGKRLRPITCTMPKPMVPLLNKPVIEYGIELLKKHGISDIAVTLRYLGNIIKKHLSDGSHLGVKIEYSFEDAPLGTAGSVAKAANNYNDTIIVLSGDAMSDIDISAAIEAHKRSIAPITIVLKKVPVPMEYGTVLTDKEGYVTRFIEKPGMSEVFSDLVNTGIYIIEPKIIKMIPEQTQYDFAKELFPLLMRKNIPIYTHVADGYWNDIGDIEQYVATQADMLDGKCSFKTNAKKDNLGIYLEEGVKISESAVITPPCYIGKECEIADNTYFGAYSVLGSGVRVGKRSSIKKSIVMEGTRIRENAEIRGAVICDRVHIDNAVSVYEKATVGSRSVLESRSTVEPKVSVWPMKRLEQDTKYVKNVIWENDGGIRMPKKIGQGYADYDLTPQDAVEISATYALLLGSGSELAIASDGTMQSVMLKYAAISGTVSQGVDVYDMGVCSIAAFSHSIRQLNLNGGIYVHSLKNNSHEAKMILMDDLGVKISEDNYRKFKQLHDFAPHPITNDRLGIVQRFNGAVKSYEAELEREIRFNKEKDNAKVVISANEDIFDSLSRIMIPKGYNIKLASESGEGNIRNAMAHSDSDMGIIVNGENEIENVFIDEKKIDREKLLTVFAMARAEDGMKYIVLPATLPREYVDAVRHKGIFVELCAESKEKFQHTVFEKGIYVKEFFETEAALARLCVLLSSGRLRKLIKEIPNVNIYEQEIGCTWREIGKLMRSLVETEKDDRVELIDGVRIFGDDGWVLVKPNGKFNACRVIAGSFKEEYAKELCELYLEKIKEFNK